MLQHKRRIYNNYLYQPDPINKYENKESISDIEPKSNINMWEAVKNTHGINRAGLNVAYKKDNSITNIGNKAFIAGTKTKMDWVEDALYLPYWNYNNMFSNAVSDVAGTQAGLATTSLVTNLTENPEI